MAVPSTLQHTGNSNLDSYLWWRRRTRLIRKYGGPIAAVLFMLVAAILIWQASKTHVMFESQQPIRHAGGAS